jgi:hypothetical protein
VLYTARTKLVACGRESGSQIQEYVCSRTCIVDGDVDRDLLNVLQRYIFWWRATLHQMVESHADQYAPW